MWETGDGPDGLVIIAHGLMVEPDVMIDVTLGLDETVSGFEPQYLPEGFVELYSGPDRADLGERKVMLIWAGPPEGSAGEITLSLLDSGPNGRERNLYSLLGSNLSGINAISETEIRGEPALRFNTADATVYQWMETSSVVARLMVQGGIDPELAVDALVEVDEPAWDATVQDLVIDRGVGSTTTVSPTTTTPVGSSQEQSTTTIVTPSGLDDPASVVDPSLLIAGIIEVDQIPDIVSCQDSDGVVLSPDRGATVADGAAYANPAEALDAFLQDQELFLAMSGYVELVEPDGTITYGRDFGSGYVTLISVIEADGQWTVNAWEASGC